MAEEQDYYKLLKDENYKTLLNREVQLNNARERALKQTNAGLSAMGMESSGYGQTAQSGVEGQYLSAMENANQTYQQQQNDINMQEQQYLQEQEANEMGNAYNSVLTSIRADETNSMERLDYVMNQYGLVKNGQFDYDKAVQMYGEDNARTLQYIYQIRKEDFASQAEQANMQEFSYDKKGTIAYYDANGKQQYIKLNGGGTNGWNKEASKLESGIKTNAFANDSYFQLKNKNGNSIYVRYYNGKLYYVTPQQYAGAQNKYLIEKNNNPVKQ